MLGDGLGGHWSDLQCLNLLRLHTQRRVSLSLALVEIELKHLELEKLLLDGGDVTWRVVDGTGDLGVKLKIATLGTCQRVWEGIHGGCLKDGRFPKANMSMKE
jgi:hypothetical protein